MRVARLRPSPANNDQMAEMLGYRAPDTPSDGPRDRGLVVFDLGAKVSA